jgi:ParB family transcriptional regulator, chromosome partitioning protein
LPKQFGFSQVLIDDLKAHRHQITRAYLAGNFEVAFDLALYALCTDLFRHIGYHSNPLDLHAVETAPRSSLNDLSGTPADRLMEAQGAALDLDWLKLPVAEAFAALAALPPGAKQQLFAWCIASTLKPQLAIEDRADPAIECVGHRLAIPFADCWRPTAANYWGRAKKAHGLDIGQQILGERWARDHAGDKKAVLAVALEAAFDPQKSSACINLGQTARDNAAAWLPPGMGYGDPAVVGIGTDTGGDDSAEIDVEAGDLPAFLIEDPAEAAPDVVP